MADEKMGLKAAKLDLIGLIKNATSEAQVRQMMAELSAAGTPNGCAGNKLSDELETELLQVFATINSNPEVLNHRALKIMAKNTLGLLRGLRNAMNIAATTEHP